MSNQTQIIIFCVLGVVAIPLGTIIAIKTINKIWRAPVNTLVSPGDIQLMDRSGNTQWVDYIHPTRPQNVYSLPDLEQELSWSERITNFVPNNWVPSNRLSNWSVNPASNWSGNPPSYQTLKIIDMKFERK